MTPRMPAFAHTHVTKIGALSLLAALAAACWALSTLPGTSTAAVDPSALSGTPGEIGKALGGNGDGGSAAGGVAGVRDTTAEPKTDPPVHGENPHGHGDVAVIDIDPSVERPLGGSPDGSDAAEEVVIGRSRAEQQADGSYHGHITIAALFGNEILGVDTTSDQTEAGPLDPLQTGLLDEFCMGSGQGICLSVLRADSSTTDSGSQNRFVAADAAVGEGKQNIRATAAESNGSIADDGSCQAAHGDSTLADAGVFGITATVIQSSATSTACSDDSTQVEKSSSVIELGGEGVPIPAPGCADGTPDTVTGIPPIAPIVCHADSGERNWGVREALAVFALDQGTAQVLKGRTAGSEVLVLKSASAASSHRPTPRPRPILSPEPTPDDSGDNDDGGPGASGSNVGAAGDSLALTGVELWQMALLGLSLIALGLAMRPPGAPRAVAVR